jgi:uncharacterized LabA/DUF88 family protein
VSGTEAARLAVLIDADNAQATLLPELLAEVARYGTASVRRAYGDWTTQNLSGWKSQLHRYAVQPVQQFRYTTGKNATDSALIIDAMDLLHAGSFDGFCLVSSDSDFTRLATRIRESGLAVYGFGEKKTPEPFVAACDRFIYTEILRAQPTAEAASPAKANPKLKRAITAALDSCARDDGWAHLGTLGQYLVTNDPAFDSRNFGYRKLSELIRAQAYLEVREETGPNGAGILFARLK